MGVFFVFIDFKKTFWMVAAVADILCERVYHDDNEELIEILIHGSLPSLTSLSTSSVWSGGCVSQSHGSICWVYVITHWISTFWLIICSWKNTNKEILVIAPGSIVKINICFLLVSCFYLFFSKTCYCSMFSCKVQTCSWHCSSCPEEYVPTHSSALAFLHLNRIY